MSEAPRADQDSRPGEDRGAGPGQPAPEPGPQAPVPERQAAGPERSPELDRQTPEPEQQGPGGDAYAWYRRGLDLLGRGSPAAAAQLLERAAEAEPGARSVLEALGRAQFDAGRYAQAADSFRQIVEASPSDDYALFGLGLALARGGDPAAAAEPLALAAAMRPELQHYTEALRGVRATLRARAETASRTASPPAAAGDDPA